MSIHRNHKSKKQVTPHKKKTTKKTQVKPKK